MSRANVVGVALLVWMLFSCSPTEESGDLPFSGVRVGEVLAGEATGFAKADRVIPFIFPRDHGVHPEFRSEWWYLTAVLVDADGNEFGMQYTLFRQALFPQSPASGESVWRSGQAYMAHLAVTDVNSAQHRADMRFSRAHPENAFVSADPFAARIDDWSLVQTLPLGPKLGQMNGYTGLSRSLWKKA